MRSASAKKPRPNENNSPHLVFTPEFAQAYELAGYVVEEVRPGVWEVKRP